MAPVEEAIAAGLVRESSQTSEHTPTILPGGESEATLKSINATENETKRRIRRSQTLTASSSTYWRDLDLKISFL